MTTARSWRKHVGLSPAFRTAPLFAQNSFIPVVPSCRVLDTRTSSPIYAGNPPPSFPITGGTCGIPSTATAYFFNVTAIPTSGMLSSVTIWPTGTAQPSAFTLNSSEGQIISNSAIVSAGTGTGNPVSIFVTNTSNVILDITGYFVAAGGGGGITALTGDVTASGTGSVPATLATVNSTPGTFGSSTNCITETVNGKGLVTAVSQTACAGGSGGVNPGTTGLPAYYASAATVGSVAHLPLVLAANGVTCDGSTDQTALVQSLYNTVAQNKSSTYNVGDIVWPTNCSGVVLSSTIILQNGLNNQIKGGPVIWQGTSGATTGSISVGSSTLTVASGTHFAVGQYVWIEGAGPLQVGLSTKITGGSGTTWNLANAASTTVSGSHIITNPVFLFSSDRNVKVSGFTIKTANSSTYPIGNAFQTQQDLVTSNANSELNLFEDNFIDGLASGGLQACFAFVTGTEGSASDNSGHEVRHNSCNNFAFAAAFVDNSQVTDLQFTKNTFHANGGTYCYYNFAGAGMTAINHYCSGAAASVWYTTSQTAHPLTIIDGVDEGDAELLQVPSQNAATPVTIINERFSYSALNSSGYVISYAPPGPLNIIGGSFGQGVNTCGQFYWTNNSGSGAYGQITGVTNSAYGCQTKPLLNTSYVMSGPIAVAQYGNVYQMAGGVVVPPTTPDINYLGTTTSRNGTASSAACDERYDSAGTLWYYVPTTGTGALTPTSTRPSNCP